MKLRKVMYIEDNVVKYMDVVRFLSRLGINHIESARNAQDGIEMIEKAHLSGEDYDLLILDMHFNFYGEMDKEAGEKTMQLLREKGVDTPVIFCSSQNWAIPGAVGSIFYHERRDWEAEASVLFQKIFEM